VSSGGFGGGGGGGGDDAAAGAGGFGSGGGGGVGFHIVGGTGGFGGGGGGHGYGAGADAGFGGGTGGTTGNDAGGGGGGGGLGGAVFNNGGTVTITNSTLTGNTAQGGNGGGVTNYGSSGTFYSPSGGGQGLGGAVFSRNGTLTITNSTLSGNAAAQGGHNVYVLSDGTGNTVTATLTNSILGQTDNTVSDFVASTNAGGNTPNLNSSSNDLVRKNPTSGGLPTAAVVSSADPLLAPLGDYGGLTPTMALLPGSPAIDPSITSGAPSQDQRGVTRDSTPDLGAYESTGFTLTKTGDNQSATVTVAFAEPLVVTLTENAFNKPLPGTAVSFTAPASGASGSFGNSTVSISGTTDANGQISESFTANTQIGSYTVTASDAGSDSVSFSLSNIGGVFSTPNPSGLGQAVTFTAAVGVLPGLPAPTGTVDFKEGSTDLTPGGVSLVAGQASFSQATFSTSNLALGSHTVTAFYSGDVNYQAGQADDSANPQVVTKLKPLADSLALGSFTQVNNLTFFTAYDITHGTELWESNGSAAGTFMVKDINPSTNPGSNGSYPQGLTNVNGTLFFEATDGTSTQEIWRSNGTAAGTFLVSDINPAATAASYPTDLTNVNGTLFFQANDGTHGNQLWESNGSAAGTFMVKDINGESHSVNPSYLTNVNGTLFFSANDGTNGPQLWASNGSAAGTFMVTDINPGPTGSDPYHLTNVNGTLFFSARDVSHGLELWESNGSVAGTFMVKDINPGTNGSDPYHLTNVNGTLFFTANDGTHGLELWESNGSVAGTFLVKDINPGTSDSRPYGLTNVNGTVFFQANDGTRGVELWASNGSAAGTFLVKDINPGSSSSYPKYLTNVNGTLFFSAKDGIHGFELWESNGSAAGTFLVQDINPSTNPGTNGSYPTDLTNVNGELFFTANDGVHGTEPWILVSTATTTSVSSAPNPSVVGKAATFTATIGVFPGLPAPTGTVDFKEGSTDLTPGGVSLTAGQATFSTSTLSVGIHTITAFYSGDINFQASQGDDSTSPHVVNKDSTNAIAFASPSSLVSGQAVALAAVISNTSGPFGIPTGAVQFAVDGANLGAPVTLNNGVATLPARLLAAGGPHTITATYTNKDGNFVGSSKSVTQAVAKDGTKTILISTPTTAVSGQVVVFTAIVNPVAPGTGTPTGRVDFKDGATDLTPGGVTMAGGKATFSTSSLALGSHTVSASYTGDGNFTSSSGNDLNSLVVNKASTRTVMTSFPDPSVFGQVVSFTVAVIALAPSQGTPTGTVVFTDGTTTIGTVTVNNVGRATFTTASLSLGNHAINANYGGDAKFKVSSDMGFGQTVLKDATTAAVTASANPAVVGTTVTFTAALQASSPGSGIPTGAVSFLDITTTLGTGTLNAAGKATFTTSALALGTHAITASYAGDTNFQASVSPILAETVKSSAMALTGSGALALSALPPVAPDPMPQKQAVNGTTLAPSGAAAQAPATLDPSRLDRYFAAVTTPSVARRLSQPAASRSNAADWLDDPFLLTN
jgi:ELWxxDGT repeat protein